MGCQRTDNFVCVSFPLSLLPQKVIQSILLWEFGVVTPIQVAVKVAPRSHEAEDNHKMPCQPYLPPFCNDTGELYWALLSETEDWFNVGHIDSCVFCSNCIIINFM